MLRLPTTTTSTSTGIAVVVGLGCVEIREHTVVRVEKPTVVEERKDSETNEEKHRKKPNRRGSNSSASLKFSASSFLVFSLLRSLPSTSLFGKLRLVRSESVHGELHSLLQLSHQVHYIPTRSLLSVPTLKLVKANFSHGRYSQAISAKPSQLLEQIALLCR